MSTSTIPLHWQSLSSPDLAEAIERLYISERGEFLAAHADLIAHYLRAWVECPTFRIPLPHGIHDRAYFLTQLDQCKSRADLIDFLVDFVAETGIDPM
jgi:hypothetical protein